MRKLFKGKSSFPELYAEEEQRILEEHIGKYYGNFPNVLHEIVSPDIHVDIFIVEPTTERNYYTLVTAGMGAHRMNVPKELRKKKLDRAELLISLPPDWDIQNPDEQWYWPIRWLKVLARLPGEQDTWLGYGHTIPTGGTFADNTELCCMLLTMPYPFDAKAAVCRMPDGDEINFYQLLPLYENEMNYKLNNGAEALEKLFPKDFNMVLDIRRDNVLDT